MSIHLSRIQMRVQIPDIPVVHKDQFVFDSALTTRGSAGLVFRSLTAACQGRQHQSAAEQRSQQFSFHKSLRFQSCGIPPRFISIQ